MLHSLLQLWGGTFYLLNKIFFSRAERSRNKKERTWRIRSWTVYLIGMPAWAIIFFLNRNWIVAAAEIGGSVVMVFGLVNAIRGVGKAPHWLDYVARGVAVLGLIYSLYDFGGITTVNQGLELGINAGFFVGVHFLAREKPVGYLWFVLMNGSNAVLQYIQGYPLLCFQQIISVGFVVDAYIMQKRKVRQPATVSATASS